MRILVTGAKGMLGSALLPCLEPQHQVRGVDLEDFDICKESAVEKAFLVLRPELVFHLAAYTDVDGCEVNPQKAQEVNVSGTRNVARACAEIGAALLYVSTDWLVDWVSGIHSGFISAKYLGWLSGWLMVLPNGLLAFYYGWRGNPEVVYTSQIGDGHVSIPLSIGIYTLYHSIHIPPFFRTGMLILLGAAVLHILFVAVLGRLPRFMGWILTATYGVFLYNGLLR